jgi:tRNA C32,U32 (ribose-2'-O)-methylase TrmJ
VILYELASARLKFEIRGHRKSSEFEREKLFDQFRNFLKSVNYPEHKRENTEVLFRRLIGRSTPSKWEFHTLMGVFGVAADSMNDRNKKDRKKKK